MDDFAVDPVRTRPSRPAPTGLPDFAFTFTAPLVEYWFFPGAVETSANPLFFEMVPSAVVFVVMRTYPRAFLRAITMGPA